jgi:hypothetical protein
LALKVQILIATGLGREAVQELDMGFDEDLALESLAYFDLRTIPALRDTLPDGVSDLRFTSDVALGSAPPDELLENLPQVSAAS